MVSNVDWIVIPTSFNFSKITTNLTCGQAFRWKCLPDAGLVGVFAHRVWQLKQVENTVSYRVLACSHWRCDSTNARSDKDLSAKRRKLKSNQKKICSTEIERSCSCKTSESKLICDYFQLGVDLEAFLDYWEKNDKIFEVKCQTCPKIRVLRQNPTETLFSFLCSVNNSISRIVPMIEKMSAAYGTQLVELGSHTFYDFPSLQALSTATEEQLRRLGFGYRARFIVACAQQVLKNGGEEWMDSLRDLDYEDAVDQLIKLPGVGRKVADCVCLMSLDKHEAVPVDTHVRQIALRDYGFVVKSKSLTNQAYKDISEYFRSLWGSHAGWAQAVLFVSEIKPLPKLYALNLEPL